MDVAYCFGAQSLGLLLCFDSLYPPFRQQFLVELLQMQRRQMRFMRFISKMKPKNASTYGSSSCSQLVEWSA